jgi:hypothetical protein
MKSYIGPIRNLGGAALIAVIVGLLFPTLVATIPDEQTRNSVLVQSIPFVAFFIAVLLLFILLIMLVAKRFNGKIPERAYRPIEMTIIAGILAGVFALFQSFTFSPYKYGFVLLLASTLSFILWSHVAPRSAKADVQTPPPLPMHAQIAGALAGIVVMVVLTSSAISVNMPQAPFGERQRVWNSYTPERQEEIAAQKTAEFNNVEVPVLIIMNLLPGLLMFFVAREVVGALSAPKANAQTARAAPVRTSA